MIAIRLDLWQFVACERCNAQPGEPCRTRNGAEAAKSHASRIFYVEDQGS